MRPRWIILGLLLAGIVYGTIIWWSERPMWKTNLSRFSELLAFNEDSKSIFILNDKRKDAKSPIDAYFSRWDVLTGKLLGEAHISVPDNLGRQPLSDGVISVNYEVSSDGAALVISGPLRSETEGNGDVFYVTDTSTGRKRFGPIFYWGSPKFSRAGRWITYVFRDENNEGVKVIDGNTGSQVLRVAQAEHTWINESCFSPDSSAIAILEHNYKASTEGEYFIRIYNLPDGKEREHFQISRRDWKRFLSWEAHHLTALAGVPDPNKLERITKVFSFDLESNPVGREAELPNLERRMIEVSLNKPIRLQTNWQEREHGIGWRVEGRFGYPEPVWLWKFWNQCAEWFGGKKDDELTDLYRLRFLDANNGWIRYQSPVFADTSLRIAPDGNLFAALTFRGELSIWNANPFPRWPWALAASLGTLLLILLLGRWRTKRLTRS